MVWSELILVPLVAAMLACNAPATMTPDAEDETAPPSERMPPGLQSLVDDWAERVRPITMGAFKSGRGSLQGQTRWTDDERAQLERLRDQARAAIIEADAHAWPWLLVGYARRFQLFGLGRDYADALLELPPEHPAWADLHSLLDVAWEASDQAAVEAYAHALAEHQDSPFLEAESLFLYLREADRNRDWARAHELSDEIAALEPRPIAGRVNVPIDDHHPDRMLRTETRVPHFCASALVGDELGRVCLDELFPHTGPTLIVGSSSWCGACREVMPQAIASTRARGVRGVLINYDQSVERARAYRIEYGIEDWPTLIPLLDGGKPEGPGDLALRSIPYMALVDEQGNVTIGPPWVDAETLDEG
jgi:hypothetical protein